jgi:4-amino-4-deoxy-L-arabinose transferase-like glycosyltransferase
MKLKIEIIILCLIIALAFVLRYSNPYFLSDLPIVPDSEQYAIGGYNISQGKGFSIYINDLRLPPQYPPGLSLILAPFYRLTGAELHEAIYVILAFSLFSILLCYLFARTVFGAPIALLSALLLTVAPLYVGYSQVLISDMVSNSFILLGLWLAWLAVTSEGKAPWLWLTAGMSCGFSATLHLLSGITIVPLLVAWWLKTRGRFRGSVPPLAMLAAGFVIGVSPLLIINRLEFGGIFRTGYDYWERWGQGQNNFSLLYAIRNTAVSEAGDARGNISFFIVHFLGLSWPTLFAPYFPSVLLLAFCGAIASVKRNAAAGRGVFSFTVMSISLIFSVLITLFFYSFQMSKFFLPTVPFVCVLAARGTVVLLKSCRGSDLRSRLLRIPVGFLLLVTALGCWWPYAIATGDAVKELARVGPRGCWQRFWNEGFLTRLPVRSFSREDLKLVTHAGPYAYWVRYQNEGRRGHAPTWWYESLKLLDEIAPDDAYLISGIDGVYASYYFTKGTHRTYMPISREVEYLRQRDLPLKVAPENLDEIERLLRGGTKFYIDGFTARFWFMPFALLANRFDLKPVRSYYNGQLYIYELLPKGQ